MLIQCEKNKLHRRGPREEARARRSFVFVEGGSRAQSDWLRVEALAVQACKRTHSSERTHSRTALRVEALALQLGEAVLEVGCLFGYHCLEVEV